jgi:hypothetical protein
MLAIDKEMALRLMSALVSLRGPAHINAVYVLMTQEPREVERLQKLILIASRGVLILHTPKGMQPAEALKSPKTTIAHKRRGVFKRVLQEMGVTVDKLDFSRRLVDLHSRLLEKSEDSELEDLDSYHKLHIYHHLAKLQPQKLFGLFDNLLSVKNVYKQILYHGSYWRYR